MSEYSELFYYDATSPSGLRWAVDRWSCMYNSVLIAAKHSAAGGKNINGYWQVNYKGKIEYVHRIIWKMHYGEIPTGNVIDHIDGDRCNNKIENLRIVEPRVNSQNAKLRSDSTTGVVGVCLSSNGYYIANWQESGKRRLKKFSIKRYGTELAFTLACEHRARKIEELILAGESYTERHGVSEK